MQKPVLINNSRNLYIQNIIKYIGKLMPEDFLAQISFWENNLFYAYQKIKPSIVIWSTSSYTQEFHNFILEYGGGCKILLIEDVPISQKDLITILNRCNNLYIISNRDLWKNRIAKSDRLYDDEIFVNHSVGRNDKYLALLSGDDQKNKDILHPIIYPNNIDKKIVVAGNPEFDSLVNIGMLQYQELPQIFNQFSYLIDIESNYHLEAAACGINIIDSNKNIQESIDNNIFVKIEENSLHESTYNKFVANNIISFIKDNT